MCGTTGLLQLAQLRQPRVRSRRSRRPHLLLLLLCRCRRHEGFCGISSCAALRCRLRGLLGTFELREAGEQRRVVTLLGWLRCLYSALRDVCACRSGITPAETIGGK